MSLRRVAWLAAIFVATIICLSCGQVYRPVVIPIENNPPNPQNFHAVFGINNNVAPNPGTALQIDVSGDSNIGQANMGINPTHAAALPNNSRIFVTSAGSTVLGTNGQLAGYPDLVTSFTPAASSSVATGLGNAVTFTLPNTGPNQSSAITDICENLGTPSDPQCNTTDPHLVTVTLATPPPQAAPGGQIIISGVVMDDPNNPKNSGAYNGNFTILSVNGNAITYDDPITGLIPTSGGTASIPLPTFCSYQPDFVTTTQATAVYVANFGVETPGTTAIPLTPNCTLPSTDSVAALNVTENTITQIAYLPPASHPTLMAETPNGQNLYVVTQGDGVSAANVLNLSTTDLSTTATIPIGVNPSWIAMRPDGQQLYVLTATDGQLSTIRTDLNTVVSPPQSVGAGANYVLYDKSLNRIYVTSPGLVYLFSATGSIGTPPSPMVTPPGNLPGTVAIPSSPKCTTATCGPVIPVSVAALPDGSRFYVASYQIQSPCSDPNAGTGSCIIPMVTVFDAGTLTIRTPSSSIFGSELSLFTAPPFAMGQYAVPEVAACQPPAVYSPSTTRFRMFATASADSSHVYVSVCDAGAIASITTTTNTVSQGTNQSDRLVIDLLAPLSVGSNTGNQTPPQSPVFLLTGQ
jgi:DNA-binding beta-propeller fold protein YncE